MFAAGAGPRLRAEGMDLIAGKPEHNQPRGGMQRTKRRRQIVTDASDDESHDGDEDA